jgi:hypothetical protein
MTTLSYEYQSDVVQGSRMISDVIGQKKEGGAFDQGSCISDELVIRQAGNCQKFQTQISSCACVSHDMDRLPNRQNGGLAEYCSHVPTKNVAMTSVIYMLENLVMM